MLPTPHTGVFQQAFEDAFDGQTINRRQWQVLESPARSPHASTRSAHDLLKMLEGFEDAQAAVHHLRDQRLLLEGPDGTLTLTDVGVAAHESATAAVATVRGAVGGALPDEDFPTLIRLLSEFVDGIGRSRRLSHPTDGLVGG